MTDPLVSYDVEQMLLGRLMGDFDACESVNYLRAEHFADPAHQALYAAIQDLVGRGRSPDPTVLRSMLADDRSLNGLGGAQYIAQLHVNSLSFVNAETAATRVYDLARKRMAWEACSACQRSLEGNPDMAADEAIEVCEREFFSLSETGREASGPRHISEYTAQVMQSISIAMEGGRNDLFISTGFRDLNEMLGGLRRGELIVLAARPSVGKTTLALNIARNVAQSGKRVVVYSLEMSGEQLMFRLLSEETGISVSDLQHGRVDRRQVDTLLAAEDRLKALPLDLDECGSPTVGGIRSAARRKLRQDGLDLIVIDYLQLMRVAGFTGSPTYEVAEITRGLKLLSRELNVPVLILSQLNRSADMRENHRPRLSDLRDSGSIEQDADAVLMIYREEYYLRNEEPSQDSPKHSDWLLRMDEARGTTSIIIAKNRNGATGTVNLRFDPEMTRFSDMPKTQPAYYGEGFL